MSETPGYHAPPAGPETVTPPMDLPQMQTQSRLSGPSHVEPYLSIVATARNDDHGGNPLYRMQIFVDALIAQCDRHKLPAELVLVEWNPPGDRPRLAEVLQWPESDGWCQIRIVEVPHASHARLEHSDRLPLFQMIGKNVGIRRARGEFVVATNIDIVFSDQLMHFIAERGLRRGYVYRVDRYDVPAELDPSWPIERQLEFCRGSAIRVNRREGTLDLRSGDFYRIYPEFTPLAWLRNSERGRRLRRSRAGRMLGLERLAFGGGVPHQGVRGRLHDSALVVSIWGSLLRRTIWTWLRMARYIAVRLYAFVYWIVAGFNDPRLVPGRIKRRLRRVIRAAAAEAGAGSPDAGVARGLRHPLLALASLPALLARSAVRHLRERLALFRDGWTFEHARVRLHTNASGDFTLMSAEDWSKTSGYAELEMYSMHIDGLQLYVAHYSGIRERFLPFAVYHVEHGGGFRPEAKGEESLDSNLALRAIPQITNKQLMDWIHEMYTTKQPMAFNGPDWGFATETFPEVKPQAARPLARTHMEVA
jgi:hypothetical protein